MLSSSAAKRPPEFASLSVLPPVEPPFPDPPVEEPAPEPPPELDESEPEPEVSELPGFPDCWASCSFLLLDLIHRCRHAIVGQPIDDLGVGEHDGFAIGKRDFVVRGLGAVRIVGAKHNMRDHTCPSISSRGTRSLLTSCPTRGSRAACACIMDGYGHAIGRNASYDQHQRAR